MLFNSIEPLENITSKFTILKHHSKTVHMLGVNEVGARLMATMKNQGANKLIFVVVNRFER